MDTLTQLDEKKGTFIPPVSAFQVKICKSENPVMKCIIKASSTQPEFTSLMTLHLQRLYSMECVWGV